MNSKIAEKMRLSGDAKFYHPISYTGVADIKNDIDKVIETYKKDFEIFDYIELFNFADYWLTNDILLGDKDFFDKVSKELLNFSIEYYILGEYNKLP